MKLSPFKILARLIGYLTILGVIILIYAHFIETKRLIIHEETIKIPNWNAKLDGLKIAVISDIHGGSYGVDRARIKQIVETVNLQKPDLVVILGDFVSQTKGQHSQLKMPVEDIAAALNGLQAKYGTYAIIGNHDWWFDETKITQELEKNAIKVLDDRIFPVQIGGETVRLWGIEDLWKFGKVNRAPFNELGDQTNTILLAHNPDAILDAPTGIALMLAGHTHGGQVQIPFYGAVVFVSNPKFLQGLIDVDGRKMFVTTGIGTTGPPFRFLVPPEIAVLTLVSQAPPTVNEN